VLRCRRGGRAARADRRTLQAQIATPAPAVEVDAWESPSSAGVSPRAAQGLALHPVRADDDQHAKHRQRLPRSPMGASRWWTRPMCGSLAFDVAMELPRDARRRSQACAS
jgi:hypothetical protein